jgi:hypothetical protein
MRINDQYFGISAKPTNRLAFKYMKLTRKFPELFQVFTNFNRKYFYHNIRVMKNTFVF